MKTMPFHRVLLDSGTLSSSFAMVLRREERKAFVFFNSGRKNADWMRIPKE